MMVSELKESAMAKRDGNEFSAQTKHHLARSVNYMCSKCGCSTSGPKKGASTSMTIGKAAHISAAAPGGPRFDPSLTSEQRRHYENGIWMCSNHASLIDEDWLSYSVDELRAMKRRAEERAADALRRSAAASLGPTLDFGLRWRPPTIGENRAGYSGLHHVSFTLGTPGKHRARGLIELDGPAGVDSVRAWISNGAEIKHEHSALRQGEPCLIPVFTEIRQPSEFWLDRQLQGANPPSPLQPGTYITDEPFLTGLHRSPLSRGIYRVRAKLLLGDSDHVEEICGEWMQLSTIEEARSEVKHPSPPDGRGREDLVKALRELRREAIHEILNVGAPSQDERGPLQLAWIPKAQAWDARVERTMVHFGCEDADVEFVRDFPLPPLRTNAYTYPMNSQWSITDVRREKLEAVIDALLGRPTFRR